MKYTCGKRESVCKNKKSTDDDEDADEIYREKNQVYFHAAVNKPNIQTLLVELRLAEEYCIVTKNQLKIPEIPIYLHINSSGGEITPAFIAVDFITACKTPIHSVVEGECASAASFISVSCNKRYICPNAYIMLHQMSCDANWGKLNEMKDTYKYYNSIDRRIKKIYLKNTQITPEKLDKLWTKDLWLNSKKCIKYGLVDEIMV